MKTCIYICCIFSVLFFARLAYAGEKVFILLLKPGNYFFDVGTLAYKEQDNYTVQWKVQNISKRTVYCPYYLTVLADGIYPVSRDSILPGQSKSLDIRFQLHGWKGAFTKSGQIYFRAYDDTGKVIENVFYPTVKGIVNKR